MGEERRGDERRGDGICTCIIIVILCASILAALLHPSASVRGLAALLDPCRSASYFFARSGFCNGGGIAGSALRHLAEFLQVLLDGAGSADGRVGGKLVELLGKAFCYGLKDGIIHWT